MTPAGWAEENVSPSPDSLRPRRLHVPTGAALKGLTEDDMLEEHRKSGPRTKVKGKWLEQTIAETMVSMSEDLYDTDDDEAPFNIKKLLRRPSRDSKVASCLLVGLL